MSKSTKWRQKALEEISAAVMKDRNADYGNPEDNFQDIADYWNIYLQKKLKLHLSSVDVAVMNNLQKVARLQTSPLKGDHMVDIAGYGVCGYACQERMKAERHDMMQKGIIKWHEKDHTVKIQEPGELQDKFWEEAHEQRTEEDARNKLREKARGAISVGDYVKKRSGTPFRTSLQCHPRGAVRVERIINDPDVLLVLEDGYGAISPELVEKTSPPDGVADPLGR